MTGRGGNVAALEPGTPVTVRHRVWTATDGDSAVPGGGRPVLADVVATVVAVGEERVELRRGDGTPVSVRLDRITGVRVLPRPPGPGRPDDPRALAEIAAAGWPAAQTTWLGNWLLRASGGWTRRANSALVLGPDRPWPAALASCRDWYAARELTPRLSVPGPAGAAAELDVPELEAAGWRPEASTVVLVARSADVVAGGDPPVGGTGDRVRRTAAPSAAWLGDYRDAATHPAAGAVLAGPPAPAQVRFAEVVAPSGIAARGRAVTLDGWVGLAAVGVAADHRRTGLGGAVVRALLADGLRHGGIRSYVEVECDNAGALAFWARLGYRRSHESLYYRLADSRPAVLPG